MYAILFWSIFCYSQEYFTNPAKNNHEVFIHDKLIIDGNEYWFEYEFYGRKTA